MFPVNLIQFRYECFHHDRHANLFMIMTSLNELEILLSRFRYLSCAGYETSLTLTSVDGHTRVALNVDLGNLPPPIFSPPPSPSRSSHRSPSYFKRLKRRSDARTNSSFSNVVDKVVTEKVDSTEKVVTVEKNAMSSSCVVISEEEAATTTEEVKKEAVDLGKLSEKDIADVVIEVNDVKHMDCTNEVQVNDAAATAYTEEVDRNGMQVLPSEKLEARTYENDETGVAKFDNDGFGCKLCGLVFESRQDLHNHNEAFVYCCWQCLTCYETLQKAQSCVC